MYASNLVFKITFEYHFIQETYFLKISYQGTGKTLVAVMTMGFMLEKNWSRPVIFLVDKILLVMQQGRYILNEIMANSEIYR